VAGGAVALLSGRPFGAGRLDRALTGRARRRLGAAILSKASDSDSRPEDYPSSRAGAASGAGRRGPEFLAGRLFSRPSPGAGLYRAGYGWICRRPPP